MGLVDRKEVRLGAVLAEQAPGDIDGGGLGDARDADLETTWAYASESAGQNMNIPRRQRGGRSKT